MLDVAAKFGFIAEETVDGVTTVRLPLDQPTRTPAPRIASTASSVTEITVVRLAESHRTTVEGTWCMRAVKGGKGVAAANPATTSRRWALAMPSAASPPRERGQDDEPEPRWCVQLETEVPFDRWPIAGRVQPSRRRDGTE